MSRGIKRIVAVILGVSLLVAVTGCKKEEKEPKPTPKATAKVDQGNTNASEKGEGQSDVPLVIACGKFSKQFNPFIAASEADRQVVNLTQIQLVTNDRAGRLIYKGIDGEVRKFGDKSYTYYGATDLSMEYDDKRNITTYRIKLRDDLIFSDGEKLTIDDVIFSLYVFCDTDYEGKEELKNMPIKGLLNYQANSTKAEKFSEKKVARYIKKKNKKLQRWIRKNITKKGITGDRAEALIRRQARIFLAQNKGKKVKNISGIKKVSDYELTITTTGYDREMSGALQIPVCALHYYGDTSIYKLEKNKFGFRRGDISAILANKTAPVGAGAYRFIKLEDNVAYFNSNELYFLGCPEIAYLQLKDMTDTLAEEREQLQEKIDAIASAGPADGATPPSEEVNPLVEVTEVKEGVVDVITGDFDSEDLTWVSAVNSNGNLSGNTVDSRFVSDGNYWYIGIHGENVSVKEEAGSEASINLRKALATIFSVSRGALKEKEGELVRIVNYPVASELWLSPFSNEENYEVAYSKDAAGQEIFQDDDESRAKTELASSMALEYLLQAGYKVEGGKAVEAPEGASLQYIVWVAGGDSNPLGPVIGQAKETLGKIGITLKLRAISDEAQLQKKLQSGSQQIWVDNRESRDMNLKARYGTAKQQNIFGICDKSMDKAISDLQGIMSSQSRRERYQECFDTVLGWAVEVPACEYCRLTLFSSKRVKTDTIPKDTTSYYSWMNEIHKIKMKV